MMYVNCACKSTYTDCEEDADENDEDQSELSEMTLEKNWKRQFGISLYENSKE